MKELLTKIILSIVTSFMLVGSVEYKPVQADSAQELAALQEISARSNELADAMFNVKVLSALNVGGLIKGSSIFRSITSFGKLTLSLLKMSGVFGRQGEDWRVTAIKNVNNRFNAVDAELGNINKHLDQIEKSINEQLSSIGEDVQKISNTLAKNNITDVALLAKKISDKIDSYENVVTSNLVTWYEVDDYPSYTRKLNVSYIIDTESGESKTVYMSKDLIEDTLEEADDWNPNRKETLIKNVFVDAMKKAIKDYSSSNPRYSDKTYDNFNEYCLVVLGKGIKDLTTKELDSVLAQFSEAAYDSLRYECTKKIARAREDDANTYASNLVGLFTTYCNYLYEANNAYTSPLKSQYEIFSNINAFQGELKCQIIYNEDGVEYIDDTNLASLAKEKYFIELNTLGAFVAQIANASGAYTTEDLRNSILLPWSTSEAALNQTYNEFYHTDVNGNEIDNYCYITDSVLKYGINRVDFCMNIGYLTYESSGKRHVDCTTKTITTDWTSTLSNDVILTNNQLSKIYAYFAKSRGKRSGMNFDFYNYLYDYKVCDNKIDETYDKSPLLITSFNGGADMGSNDKITMIAWPFYHEYNEKYVRQSTGTTYEKVNKDNETYTNAFYKEIVTGATPEMVFKRKGVANTFNPLTGEAQTNTTVGAAAMHFHDYKTQDDIAMLVSAEYMPTKYMFKNPYNGPEDTAFNFNVSSAQLWKKNWYGSYISDTSKGQENIYAINSCRHYGSIISNDVNVYKTNGKISNTNTIDVVNNSNSVANNYVKNVSFTDGNYLTNDVIKNDEDVKNSYLNAATNARDKFEKLLETLYPGKEEEIAKLKANKIYSISFDNDNCTNVDDETYKAAVLKLVDYLSPDDDGNNANINSMITDFRDLYSEITKTIDVFRSENNETRIDLSDEDYNRLIETIIAENIEEEFTICKTIDDIPRVKGNLYIFCEEDGEIYKWDDRKYVKYRDTKEARTYIDTSNGTTIVVDDVYKTRTIPEQYYGEYIYNTSNRKYYKWNVEEAPEHFGEYELIKKIKAVKRIPSNKETDYLFNSSDGKFYQWKKDLESKYVKVEDIPAVDSLDSYSGQIVKYCNDYYKWDKVIEIDEDTNEEIVVDKYIPVAEAYTLPTEMDDYYLVWNRNCYKWSTVETKERYVEISKVPQVGSIVVVDTMPEEYVANFIQLDDRFYKWVEKPYEAATGGKYIETKETVKQISELDRITTKPENPVEVDFYPSTLAKQLKLVYEIKPTISFELFFDREIRNVADVEKANIDYKVVPYFDIKPMLTWVDSKGVQKYLTINDDVLRKANIGSISVKIPVLQMNNQNDNIATIYHYESMEQTSCPIDEFNAKIITENGAKYATIAAKSFSPFMVKKTYTRNSNPSEKYNIPKTGIR